MSAICSESPVVAGRAYLGILLAEFLDHRRRHVGRLGVGGGDRQRAALLVADVERHVLDRLRLARDALAHARRPAGRTRQARRRPAPRRNSSKPSSSSRSLATDAAAARGVELGGAEMLRPRCRRSRPGSAAAGVSWGATLHVAGVWTSAHRTCIVRRRLAGGRAQTGAADEVEQRAGGARRVRAAVRGRGRRYAAAAPGAAQRRNETGCEILAKAEFMNPGGSVKDRAARPGRGRRAARSPAPGRTMVDGTAGVTGTVTARLPGPRLSLPDRDARQPVDRQVRHHPRARRGTQIVKAARPMPTRNHFQKVAAAAPMRSLAPTGPTSSRQTSPTAISRRHHGARDLARHRRWHRCSSPRAAPAARSPASRAT